MGVTSVYALPYPELTTDPPNGPAQIQALAQEVETELVRIDALATTHESEITALQQQVDFPTFMLRRAAAQSIGSGAFTAISWDTEDNDSHNGHDNTTNPDRYTVQKAGLYQVCGGVAFVGHATGIRITRLTKNGVVVAGSAGQGPNLGVTENATAITRTVLIQCAVNDIIRLEVWQNSGGALNTAATDYVQPSLAGHWVKP